MRTVNRHVGIPEEVAEYIDSLADEESTTSGALLREIVSDWWNEVAKPDVLFPTFHLQKGKLKCLSIQRKKK